MRRVGDKEADVEVRTFVARAGEGDVAQTEGFGGLLLFLFLGGFFWVVVVAWGEGFVVWWVAGWECGWRCVVEKVDFFVEVGLLD